MKKDLNNCLSCPKFKEEMSHKSGPAWDIASDISVMQTMMSQDGLMQGQAMAAQDGMMQSQTGN